MRVDRLTACAAPAFLLATLLAGCGSKPNGTGPDQDGAGTQASAGGEAGSNSAAPKADLVNITDFTVKTSRFRGKTISLLMMVVGPADTRDIRELRKMTPGTVRFVNFSKNRSEGLDIWIYVPEGIDVPDVSSRDTVKLTFKCGEGLPQSGNVALAIEPYY